MTSEPIAPVPIQAPADAASAARIVVAAALVGAGLVHLAAAGPHLADSTSHGAFFLAVAWTQLGFGVLFATGRGGRVALGVAALLSVGVLAVWVVSRTAGISGAVEAIGFPDTLASTLELLAAAGCVRIALSPSGWFEITPATRGAVAGVSVTAVAFLVSASLVPAFAGSHVHGANHEHVSASGPAHDHSDATGGGGHSHTDSSASSSGVHDHSAAATTQEGGSTAHDHGGATTLTSDAAPEVHDHGSGLDPATTATAPDHQHHDPGVTTTTSTPGHDHGGDTGTGTETDGHDHPTGTGTGTDDWETIRRTALIGGASEATQAAVKDASAAFLADKIRSTSSALKKLPATDREARIALFTKWTIDHALDFEHGGNHTHGPAAWIPMGAADTLALQTELRTASTVLAKYPTAAAAVAAGYMQVTPWVPGIGAHYLNAGLVGHFDPAAPSMLLYDGNAPTSELVGVSYVLHLDARPSGFTGPNDEWHEHPQLCLIGAFVIGGDNTPPELCALVGATKGNGFGGGHLWMMHVWQVPGWESSWGLFSGENPNLNLATTDVGRTS
jgi:hypothetical protein